MNAPHGASSDQTCRGEQDDHVGVIRTMIRNAEAGDYRAARFLLEEFVNHHRLFFHARLPESDRAVLEYVVSCFREVLDKGVPPQDALLLTRKRGGQEKDWLVREIVLARDVYRHLQAFRKSSVPIVGGDVSRAIEEVARERSLGRTTVQNAWLALGGEAGVRTLLEDEAPDLPA